MRLIIILKRNEKQVTCQFTVAGNLSDKLDSFFYIYFTTITRCFGWSVMVVLLCLSSGWLTFLLLSISACLINNSNNNIAYIPGSSTRFTLEI